MSRPITAVTIQKLIVEWEKTVHNPTMKIIRDDPKQTKLIAALFDHREALMRLYNQCQK